MERFFPVASRSNRPRCGGVVSQGMLCSAKELGISEASEGILEVDANEASLGEDIRRRLAWDAATLVLKLTPQPRRLPLHAGRGP